MSERKLGIVPHWPDGGCHEPGKLFGVPYRGYSFTEEPDTAANLSVSLCAGNFCHHVRTRDTEEIAWLMKYARGVDWKAPERKDADKAADRKTTDQ